MVEQNFKHRTAAKKESTEKSVHIFILISLSVPFEFWVPLRISLSLTCYGYGFYLSSCLFYLLLLYIFTIVVMHFILGILFDSVLRVLIDAIYSFMTCTDSLLLTEQDGIQLQKCKGKGEKERKR